MVKRNLVALAIGSILWGAIGEARSQGIESGGATLVSESWPTPNGAIDPEEAVTVALCVQNTGAADTPSLTGKLEQSGGILAPSAAQDYGVLVAGAPGVCRNFTFSAAPNACNSKITAKLSLYDGDKLFDEVSYEFTLGSGGVCTEVACDITCPANITVSNDANQCGAVVNYPAPTTQGTCGTITCSPASGSFFPKGVNEVTCTGSSGGACSFTITVNDTQPPSITCPANITVSNDANQCGAVVNYPAPIASDNCPGLTLVCTPASGSFFPKGTNTITCTATDQSNNTATCSFTITVNDTQPPSITCPANITVSNDQNQCGAVVTYSPPSTSDNCPGVQLQCSPASGSFFPIGTTTVTCTSTDSSGNTATCSFTVTVQDTQKPAITCPESVAVSNDTNQCGAIVNFAAPTVSDNCPGVNLQVTPASGSFFAIGTTPVTATATDAAGNETTCQFYVAVTDTQAPIITCPANLTTATAEFASNSVVIFAEPVVTDNCPNATVVCTPASGSVFPLGTTTVNCVATDAHGNQSSCSFTVTVFDVAIQDDNFKSRTLFINTSTGAYIYCCDGEIFTGTGRVRKSGACKLSMNVRSSEMTLNSSVDKCKHRGSATLRLVRSSFCQISDSNTADNVTSCP